MRCVTNIVKLTVRHLLFTKHLFLARCFGATPHRINMVNPAICLCLLPRLRYSPGGFCEFPGDAEQADHRKFDPDLGEKLGEEAAGFFQVSRVLGFADSLQKLP